MNYPDGVTQSSFDRESERLNESTVSAAMEIQDDINRRLNEQCETMESMPVDPDAMLHLEMSLHPERFIRKSDAEQFHRIAMRIDQLANFRYTESWYSNTPAAEAERECARHMWRIVGGMEFRIFHG